MSPTRWSLFLSTLLAAHIVWGFVRLPGKVIQRRLDDIHAFRRDGDSAFHFRANRLSGIEVIEWLRHNTAPDTAVAWEGDDTGAIEFAAALLWPRLLVRAGQVATATEFADRVIATGTRNGRTGRLVLRAARSGLDLEVR